MSCTAIIPDGLYLLLGGQVKPYKYKVAIRAQSKYDSQLTQLLEIVHYFTVSMTSPLKMYSNFVLAY